MLCDERRRGAALVRCSVSTMVEEVGWDDELKIKRGTEAKTKVNRGSVEPSRTDPDTAVHS